MTIEDMFCCRKGKSNETAKLISRWIIGVQKKHDLTFIISGAFGTKKATAIVIGCSRHIYNDQICFITQKTYEAFFRSVCEEYIESFIDGVKVVHVRISSRMSSDQSLLIELGHHQNGETFFDYKIHIIEKNKISEFNPEDKGIVR